MTVVFHAWFFLGAAVLGGLAVAAFFLHRSARRAAEIREWREMADDMLAAKSARDALRSDAGLRRRLRGAFTRP